MKYFMVSYIFIFIIACTGCFFFDDGLDELSNSMWIWEHNGSKTIYKFNDDVTEFIDTGSLLPKYKKLRGKFYRVSIGMDGKFDYYLDPKIKIELQDEHLIITEKWDNHERNIKLKRYVD